MARGWEEMVVSCFEVISWNMYEENKANDENITRDSKCNRNGQSTVLNPYCLSQLAW
jgi:hypothetical protein